MNVGAALPAGSNVIGALSANQSVNVAQVAATAASVNVGVADAGSQRVVMARNSEVCNPIDGTSVAINVATAATTQLVALVSGQTIYVCHYNFMSAGTTNVTLVYGTGTACATGQVALTGAYNTTAQTGVSADPRGLVKTASANALCIINSAAIQVSGVLAYRQF